MLPEFADQIPVFAGDVVGSSPSLPVILTAFARTVPGTQSSLPSILTAFARSVRNPPPYHAVPKKKPSPHIYNLAATTLGVNPARCVVVEDTRIGLLAGEGGLFAMCPIE